MVCCRISNCGNSFTTCNLYQYEDYISPNGSARVIPLVLQAYIGYGNRLLSAMEAILFDGKTLTLKYETDHPIPRITKDNDVIVKVEYSGLCGTDLHIIQGEFPASKEGITLGHEISGVVHDAGKTSIFTKGQRVVVDPNRACNLCEFCRNGRYQFCLRADSVGVWRNGGWARYVCVPQEQLFHLPEEISTQQGALCEPYSCVVHGFDRVSPLAVGCKILIMGSGIIGNMWVTTLHHQGHRDVTVSGRNKAKLEFFKKMETGYRLITPDVLDKEKETYDIIIDCTGVASAMETCKYLRPGGKYVVFGCCPSTHYAQVNPFEIYEKEISIIGVKVNPFSFPGAIAWLSVMGDRYLDYEKLGVKMYTLSDYQMALRDLKTGAIAKAVFKIK